MSKVYVVLAELYEHDHVGAGLLGSAIEGVFDSEEKAVEDIKKNYGDDYCDYFDGDSWKSYRYDTYEGMVSITVAEWEVNKSLWEDLA